MPKRDVPSIVGPRTRLRPLNRDDLERTLAWRNRDDNRRWFLHSQPITWEQHTRWFEAYSARDDDFVFVVEDLSAGGVPVGQAALYRIDWTEGSAEFGRLLIGEPSARGRRLGQEITALLVDFGFRHWGLRRIHLEVFAHNQRAIGIYRECGFEDLGPRDDVVLMEAKRNDWLNRGLADGLAQAS